jgi:biotin transport system substrate-specific component
VSVLTANTVISSKLWAEPSDRTKSILREAVLILGFALLTAAAAQWELKLGFTPIPITGQTFAVLISGAALGMRSGAASQALYWAMGLAHLPFFADGAGGWKDGTGTSIGYFVGFILAAATIGYMAERRQDRNIASSVAAMAAGTVVIYVCGAIGLMLKLDIPLEGNEGFNAMTLGVSPFLVGDFVKLMAAGAVMPAAWALVGKIKKS